MIQLRVYRRHRFSDALRVFAVRTLVAARQADLNKDIIRGIVWERKSNFLSTDSIL